jgi:hypothetical protein
VTAGRVAVGVGTAVAGAVSVGRRVGSGLGNAVGLGLGLSVAVGLGLGSGVTGRQALTIRTPSTTANRPTAQRICSPAVGRSSVPRLARLLLRVPPDPRAVEI